MFIIATKNKSQVPKLEQMATEYPEAKLLDAKVASQLCSWLDDQGHYQYGASVRPVDIGHYVLDKGDILPRAEQKKKESPEKRTKVKPKTSLFSQTSKLRSQASNVTTTQKTFQMIISDSSSDEDFNYGVEIILRFFSKQFSNPSQPCPIPVPSDQYAKAKSQ